MRMVLGVGRFVMGWETVLRNGIAVGVLLGLVATGCGIGEALAAEQEVAVDAVTPAAQLPAVVTHRRTPLDRRVQLLARELELDTVQQVKVRALLEGQREQVQRVWSNTATPSAVRVSNTQIIGERTADQMRALLTEEQRKKYTVARQREASDASKVSVETWMSGTQAK
jgi:hypothetical protein